MEAMKSLVWTSCLLAATIVASPALGEVSTCRIWYANNLGAKSTREIRQHEIAHCNCTKWSHPVRASMYAEGTKPPRYCLGKFNGRLIEYPMSDKKVIAKFGSIGHSEWEIFR